MSELISGKEALIALANGEKVLIRSCHWDNFDDLTSDFKLCVFDSDEYEFRLKPKTITINRIEVLAPIEDITKFKSDKSKIRNLFVYYLDSSNSVHGYSGVRLFDLDSDKLNGSGWSNVFIWKTEDEIKQVVAALRSVFKCTK